LNQTSIDKKNVSLIVNQRVHIAIEKALDSVELPAISIRQARNLVFAGSNILEKKTEKK